VAPSVASFVRAQLTDASDEHSGVAGLEECNSAARVLREPAGRDIERRFTMLYWAAVFFALALIAAAFGFFGLAAGAAGIAKILFFVFLVVAVVSLIFNRRVPV